MIKKTKNTVPFETVIADILHWFKKAKAKGMIIGGVAASLLGRPRTTRDIDTLVILDESEWVNFIKVGATLGFVPRIKDVLAFAKKNRVMLLRHAVGGIDVDISFGALPFEHESMKRVVHVKAGGLSIPLPTPEDLIIMKSVAHRPRDLADVESILDAHRKVDLKRIRHWVREFSIVLEMPEIYDDLERILKGKCASAS